MLVVARSKNKKIQNPPCFKADNKAKRNPDWEKHNKRRRSNGQKGLETVRQDHREKYEGIKIQEHVTHGHKTKLKRE